jgi:hypothetical protein
MPVDFRKLARDDDLAESIYGICEFALVDGAPDLFPYVIEPAAPIASFGRDGAGGRFYRHGENERALYIMSDGRWGVIAADADEAMAMMLACPHWRDALKFSAGGSLDAMRRAAAYFAASDADLRAEIDALRTALDVESLADPVGRLHDAMTRLGAAIRVSAYGQDCASLFGDLPPPG